MKRKFLFFLISLISVLASAEETSQKLYVNCGGRFEQFIERFISVALNEGHSPQAVKSALYAAKYDERVILNSRRQHFLSKNFSELYTHIKTYSLEHNAHLKLQEHAHTFALAEEVFGVDKEVLAVLWGIETNFGGQLGNYNVINSLTTLSYDCANPAIYQHRLLAAIKLIQLNALDPERSRGAWAGEMGQFKFVPENILDYGVDGDGDGRVNLRNSAADAILTAARRLQTYGWRSDQPWVQEVLVSKNTRELWSYSGLSQKLTVAEWNLLGIKDVQGHRISFHPELLASLLAPEGATGSLFLVYNNFDVLLKWNSNLIYTLATAVTANSLKPEVAPLTPKPVRNGLSVSELIRLQRFLKSYGHVIREDEGVFDSDTILSVQKLQANYGMMQDGWPTQRLFMRLGL